MVLAVPLPGDVIGGNVSRCLDRLLDGGPEMEYIRDESQVGVLVLRVWHEPGFRARITFGDPNDDSATSIVVASRPEVLEFVRDWLDIDPEPP